MSRSLGWVRSKEREKIASPVRNRTFRLLSAYMKWDVHSHTLNKYEAHEFCFYEMPIRFRDFIKLYLNNAGGKVKKEVLKMYA